MIKFFILNLSDVFVKIISTYYFSNTMLFRWIQIIINIHYSDKLIEKVHSKSTIQHSKSPYFFFNINY